MYRTTLLTTLALALASRSTAQTLLESSDVAPECASVCTNIVTESDNCEREFDNVDNSDQQEQDCLCNAQGMNTAIPECEACQRQYYNRDDDYDEIQTILSVCGFSSMSATGTMTSMGSAPTGGSTTVITSTYTETDDDNDNDDDDLETTIFTSVLPAGGSATTTATDLAGSASDAANSVTGGGANAATSATGDAGSAASSATDAAGSATDSAGSAAEQSGNFAPVMTAAPVLAMAGVAAAVFGL